MDSQVLTLWDTEHPTSTTVLSHVYKGVLAANQRAAMKKTRPYIWRNTPSILYGILRGNAKIIERCIKASLDWWFLDNGYFRPGHFDGYYLIAKNQLQPKFSPSAPVDRKRWADLKIPVSPWRTSRPDSHVLVCPPTPPIASFYKIDKSKWIRDTVTAISKAAPGREVRVREKGTPVPLQRDFLNCHCVVTFNSKVAIDALINGIPAIQTKGIVRDWNGLSPQDVSGDLTSRDRLPLFQFAASCQFRLEEFLTGAAWKAARRVLN